MTRPTQTRSLPHRSIPTTAARSCVQPLAHARITGTFWRQTESQHRAESHLEKKYNVDDSDNNNDDSVSHNATGSIDGNIHRMKDTQQLNI